jgi:PHD/YefM family antitoxin component YafN of YafNO toxin-antitoxin module
MEQSPLGYRLREVALEDAAGRLEELADAVGGGCEIVVLRRDGGQPVALIDERELAMLIEEVHVLRSAANVQRLNDATGANEGVRFTPGELSEWLANQRKQLARGA